jgi:hypothetical protein
MERTKAIKEIKRLLGAKAAWEVNPTAPDQEMRDAAKAALQPRPEQCLAWERLAMCSMSRHTGIPGSR